MAELVVLHVDGCECDDCVNRGFWADEGKENEDDEILSDM